MILTSLGRAIGDKGPSHQEIVAVGVARAHTAIDSAVCDACNIVNAFLGAIWETFVSWRFGHKRPWLVWVAACGKGRAEGQQREDF